MYIMYMCVCVLNGKATVLMHNDGTPTRQNAPVGLSSGDNGIAGDDGGWKPLPLLPLLPLLLLLRMIGPGAAGGGGGRSRRPIGSSCVIFYISRWE